MALGYTSGGQVHSRAWHVGLMIACSRCDICRRSSIPAVTLHPSQKFMACQSMNNQIVVYQAYGGFKYAMWAL